MKNILLLGLLALIATPVYAHEGHVHVVPEANAQLKPTPTVSPVVFQIDEFSDEGLSDLDVEADAEAEILPSDGFVFGLENAWFKIRRAVTFQVERKAKLDRARLHRLDRKLTACAELGDEACVDRIDNMISKTEERAQAYLESKQGIRDRFQEKFASWRERRGERIEALRDVTAERKERKDELLEKRKEALDEIRKRREEFSTYRKGQLEEIRNSQQTIRQETKHQVREQIIEQRSERVKQELDATRNRVEERNTSTREVLRATE